MNESPETKPVRMENFKLSQHEDESIDNMTCGLLLYLRSLQRVLTGNNDDVSVESIYFLLEPAISMAEVICNQPNTMNKQP